MKPDIPGEIEPSTELCRAQRALLQELVGTTALREMLEHLSGAIERCAPGLMASILLVEGRCLRCGAAPSLPVGYNRTSDNVPIGEGFGSCGTAAYRRELVIAADIQNDVLWKNYRDIARRYELGACWSTPIFGASGEVLGTFALYHHEPRRPRPDELWLVHEFSILAAVAIEHHHTREALRESERSFRALVDDLDAIVWESDAETRQYTYVSKRAEEVLGYPLRRWREEPDFWRNIVHPEDREATVRRAMEAIRECRHHDLEYRVMAADGRVVWVRDIVGVQIDAKSRARYLRGVMMNISRQREAEQEREEMLQRLVQEQTLIRAVMQQMPEGVIIAAAPSGSILMANDQVERIWRQPIRSESLDQYPVGQSFHPDGLPYRPEDWPMSRAVRYGEAIAGEEIGFQRGDGSRGTMAVSAVPVRDADGRIVAGVALLSDITERKQADADQRFLADAGATLVSSLDAEATVRSVALLAAQEFADWCMIFTRTELGGVRCVALGHRDPAKSALATEFDRLLPQPGGAPFHLSRVLATGRSELFTEISRKAFEPGAIRPELMRLVRTLGAESVMNVAMQVRDQVIGAIVYVSARADRRYGARDLAVAEELARRAALALESARLYRDANAAIHQREEFLAIATHELKTPLASLQLSLQTLVRQLDKPDVDREVLRERALAGERQGHRLGRLIDELLDVSSIRGGRLRLELAELDLVEAVRAVLVRYKEELTLKGIDVAVHAPSPVFGCWDRLRLEQVITNLISNAIKYGQDRPVRIAVEADATSATLHVEDRGMGMSPQLLQRLFRPFERGVAAGHYGGLGLGLYITAQIVRAHGGAVRVRSVLSEGSTMTVELPRKAAA